MKHDWKGRHLAAMAISRLAVATALLTPAAGYAQAVDQSEEITVTATRGARLVTDVPSSITILSDEELANTLKVVATIDGVLERLAPGMGVAGEGVSSSGSTGNGPQLRGRPASVLINGVQVNTLLRSNGIDTQLIDPNAIGRIEVKRGASAAFGFGAPGGVIQFLTRKGETENLAVTARISTDFSEESVQDSMRLRTYLGVSQKIDDLDFHVGFGYQNIGEAFAPDGRNVSDESYASYNLDANIGLQLSDTSELRFTGNFHRRNTTGRFVTAGTLVYAEDDTYSNYIAPPGILSDRVYDDPTPFDQVPGYQVAYIATVDYVNRDVFGSTLTLTGFVQQNTLRLPFLDSNYEVLEAIEFAPFGQRLDNSRVGFRVNMQTDVSLFSEKDLNLSYGVDWVRDQMVRTRTTGFGSPDRVTRNVPGYGDVSVGLPTLQDFPLSPAVELVGLAPYVQADFKVGRARFTGGIRYEDSSPASLGMDTIDGRIESGDLNGFGKWLFNAGVVVDVTDRWQVYGGMSQGVEITELGRAVRAAAINAFEDDDVASIEDLQVVALDPAVTTEFEIGVRGKFGGLDAAIAAFYSRAPSSARVAPPPGSPPGTIFQPVREPTQIWGLEGTLDYRIDDVWKIGALFSIQDGKVRFEGADEFTQLTYDRIAPPRISLFLDIKPTEDLFVTVTGTQLFSRSPFPDQELVQFGGAGDGNFSGYFLMDLAATYKVGPGDLGFGISNLFNNTYLDPSTQVFRDVFFQVPRTGRRFQLSYITQF